MKRTALKRTSSLKRTGKLPVMSKKRSEQSRIYAKRRRAFLKAHQMCQVFYALYLSKDPEERALVFSIWPEAVLIPVSCDIHHKTGRSGTNYLDESTWMAVSREGHDWIHSHPSEARAKGWLL